MNGPDHPIRQRTAGGLSLPILAALLNGAASMDLGSPRSRRPSSYPPAKEKQRNDSRKALRKARRANRRKA